MFLSIRVKRTDAHSGSNINNPLGASVNSFGILLRCLRVAVFQEADNSATLQVVVVREGGHDSPIVDPAHAAYFDRVWSIFACAPLLRFVVGPTIVLPAKHFHPSPYAE